MFINYLQTAIRVLQRNRSYTLINVVGLSIGISSALIIFSILHIHTGFDRFHSKKDRIYRVVTDSDDNGKVNHTQGSPILLATAMQSDLSQVEFATRTYYADNDNGLISIYDTQGGASAKFKEDEGVAFVEPELFKIFDFPLIHGSSEKLSEPFTAILTESIARKYFGSSDVLGRTFRFDNKFDFKIIGVAADFPVNTELPFRVMMSLESGRNNPDAVLGLNLSSWGNLSSNTNTWVLLKEGATAKELEDQLPALSKKHQPVSDITRNYRVQPLADVHYATDYDSYSGQTTDRSTLYALFFIALFLIATACINFINLATAQAVRRAKEIGVRKVLGANRTQLVIQFLGETFLITMLSVLIGVMICELTLPFVLNALTLQAFKTPIDTFTIFFVLSAITFSVTLFSGFYPAMILSGYRPAFVLKSSQSSEHAGGLLLRRGLVMIQFVISQSLIIATLIAVGQLDFLRTRNIGFSKDAVVTVPLPNAEPQQLESLRSRFLEFSGIEAVTFGYAAGAVNFSWNTIMRHMHDGKEERIRTMMRVADAYHIPTMGLQMIAGRNYTKSDTLNEIVVNETFVKTIGWTSPQDAIGKIMMRGNNKTVPIVGVVKDWNTNSLHSRIRPVVLGNYASIYREAGIKIRMTQSTEAMAHIQKVWNETFPEYVFSSEFLDERIERFYQNERLTSNLFTTFAGIAILIGCLGLFGLVAFMVNRKTKEIGVRKVLGASIVDILKIFAGEFSRLIVVAFIIAAPLTYYIMQEWLQDFEYRVAIGAGVFVLALCVSLLIAAVSVGYQVLRAARANPVHALKYE